MALRSAWLRQALAVGMAHPIRVPISCSTGQGPQLHHLQQLQPGHGGRQGRRRGLLYGLPQHNFEQLNNKSYNQ
jgi:hypothetical protein